MLEVELETVDLKIVVSIGWVFVPSMRYVP
jgi:hypothetical protein